MSEKYKELKKCLCCDGEKLMKTLDLKDQPLANCYHKGEKLPRYPLAINLCLDCYHVQLTVAVDPDEMFKNYLYVSGTTKTLKNYFNWFADYVHTKYLLGKDPENVHLLDIACNDGTQLESFKKYGYNLYGVDPAENLAPLSVEKGINLKVGYWDSAMSDALPKMNVIIAQNVFAHNSNPYDFLLNCKKSLTPNGTLFIQTSQANMFKNNEFDTIYHEHISFFSAKSMNAICQRAGMKIVESFKPDIHGTSYVFVIKDGGTYSDEFYKFLKKEEEEGKYDPTFYYQYNKNAHRVVDDLKSYIENVKSNGLKVVGYGAAAKGTVLLNFAGIELDYIVDDNPMKHGYMIPGMDILIEPPEKLKQEKAVVIIPLAWNFFSEIKSKVKTIRGNAQTTYVKYFPDLKVIQ